MTLKLRSRKVCMLGGSGFVGSHIAALLVKDAWSVSIPTRNRARHRPLLVLPGVDLVQANVHDERELARLLEGSDAAINLVGIANEKGHDGREFRAVHAELTAKLVRACTEAGVTRLLHMSALKANAERGPSHYLKSKGEGEQQLASLAGEDLNYTIFQPSVIFGPGDSFINLFARLMRVAPMLALPRLSTRFAPVYVGDVAAAFKVALEDASTYGRTYQLCGPDIYSLGEILRFVQRVLGIKRPLVELPDSLGRLEALAIEYLVPGKPFSRDNLRSLTVASLCTENGLAALGVRARSLDALLPTYLPGALRQRELQAWRQTAGR
jgi:uncharacterized protein YbjT (DUF2867 family)